MGIKFRASLKFHKTGIFFPTAFLVSVFGIALDGQPTLSAESNPTEITIRQVFLLDVRRSFGPATAK